MQYFYFIKKSTYPPLLKISIYLVTNSTAFTLLSTLPFEILTIVSFEFYYIDSNFILFCISYLLIIKKIYKI